MIRTPSLDAIFTASGLDPETAAVDLMRADHPLAGVIYAQANDLAQTEQSIRDTAGYLTRELERTMGYLDQALGLNSCGVIQSSGPKLDMLVAKREALASSLRDLLHVYATHAEVAPTA
jgi:hypothetical protein